jgi:electron transport complex protein RnfG
VVRVKVYIILVLCGAITILFASVHPVIFAQEAIGESALKDVFPEAESFEPVKSAGNILYYKAYGSGSLFIGAVFKASQKGYSSVIETMVGMKKDGAITAIKVLSQNETPGVGAKVAEQSFAGQFRGRSAQELNNVMAVTGATISSRAVVDSVKNKAEEIMALLKEQK